MRRRSFSTFSLLISWRRRFAKVCLLGACSKKSGERSRRAEPGRQPRQGQGSRRSKRWPREPLEAASSVQKGIQGEIDTNALSNFPSLFVLSSLISPFAVLSEQHVLHQS